MKKLALLIAMLVLLSLISLYATPPSKITLDYNKTNGNLDISFLHQSGNPLDHYIYDASIMVNKKEIVHQTMSAQDAAEGGNLFYKVINVKAGDTISITLKCNKFGKKTEVYTVK